MLRFLQAHPNLEYLCVEYMFGSFENAVWQLLQLKSLFCSYHIIDKGNNSASQFLIFSFTAFKLKMLHLYRFKTGMIDGFVVNYPNIEALHLENTEHQNPDHRDCLSLISFPRLIKLSLQGFHLHDGLFLLSVIKFYINFIRKDKQLIKLFCSQIIKESPKLERIHLSDTISSIDSFVLNLDSFLEKALKLKDFR